MGTPAERDHYGTYRLYAGLSVGPLAHLECLWDQAGRRLRGGKE